MNKSYFVKKYLKPLILASNIAVEDVKYEHSQENQTETVILRFINGHEKSVNVSFDSLTEMVKDVFKYGIN